MDEKLKNCSVCGKSRYEEEEREQLWKSDLIIAINEVKKRITVCPECRRKPLVDILVATCFGNIKKEPNNG